MDNSEENGVNKINKDKTLTARFLSSANISAMMSGSQKGIPLKVPSIPIKVVTTNATQSSTIPGVLVAKPNPGLPGGGGATIRAANAANFILKGKAIPLVLEKSKSPVQNCNDLVMTSTSSVNATPSLPGLVTPAPNSTSTSKVPNILRGTNSPSKNTIDRQVVSHEATIELRKNNLGILSKNIPTSTNNGSNTTTPHCM